MKIWIIKLRSFQKSISAFNVSNFFQFPCLHFKKNQWIDLHCKSTGFHELWKNWFEKLHLFSYLSFWKHFVLLQSWVPYNPLCSVTSLPVQNCSFCTISNDFGTFHIVFNTWFIISLTCFPRYSWTKVLLLAI